ncbi:uncharacterized protein EDB91DRAFT_1353100 [Suillus paluster]|uniref:uncharacterized protein n=1 Tax=Suillus paluster TaxID=48578 RepID=UPI001B86AE62|nr:uncharacterized protein EDB91DRAFT_1353100 [Suillus paluster]KAG1717280.1 hypothetical protein EDB91DRAFT_1353100 [Suillus paluster]
MLMEDPNEAIRPDFTSPEHQDERQPLIAEGLSEEQAARSLTALWNVNNNADKERWALRQRRLQDIRQREEEDEEQPAVKDPKAAPIVKDENLSWEDFNEAAPQHDLVDESP